MRPASSPALVIGRRINPYEYRCKTMLPNIGELRTANFRELRQCEVRRIHLLRTRVNSRAGSSTDSYAASCPTLGRLLNAPLRSVRPGDYRVSARSVRPVSTTCSIAALVTCESPLSYNSDSCVAPSTTRWMLCDESAASSSCISSQSDDCSPALTTARGLSPRLWVLRT